MRKVIKTRIRQIFTMLCTVLGIGTLTSCYGCPIYLTTITGKVTSTQDTDGNGEKDPIKNIKVRVFSELYETASTSTRDDGTYDVTAESYGYGDFKIDFIDEDPYSDGNFTSGSYTLKSQDDTVVNIELALRKDTQQ